LEKHSLLFAFQDGKVEHLCSNPEEAMWVTNIKRGILSMLQNIVDVNEDSAIVQEVIPVFICLNQLLLYQFNFNN